MDSATTHDTLPSLMTSVRNPGGPRWVEGALVAELGHTAPTGSAAVEINGSTIHGFADINYGKITLASISAAQAAATHLSGIALLILDEVSLVSAEHRSFGLSRLSGLTTWSDTTGMVVPQMPSPARPPIRK